LNAAAIEEPEISQPMLRESLKPEQPRRAVATVSAGLPSTFARSPKPFGSKVIGPRM